MTAQSQLGKRIEDLAREYKETQDLIEQTPAEEIKYLLTQYQKVLQNLTKEGITPSHTPLEELTKKVSQRLEQLLPQITPNDKELLKLASPIKYSQQKLRNLEMFPQEEWGKIILEGIAEEISSQEKLEVIKGGSLTHTSYKSAGWLWDFKDVYSIIQQEKGATLAEYARFSYDYFHNGKLYIISSPEMLQAISKIKEITAPEWIIKKTEIKVYPK